MTAKPEQETLKELLEKVAGEVYESEYPEGLRPDSPTYKGFVQVLRRKLLPLLQAGVAMRETFGEKPMVTSALDHDAALKAALEGASGRSVERYLEDLERGGNPA